MSKLIELATEMGKDVIDEKRPHGAHVDTWRMLATYTPNREGARPRPYASRSNLAMILENDPEYSTLAYNDHADVMLYKGREIDDPMLEEIAIGLERSYRYVGTDTIIKRGVMRVCSARKLEPIKDWLCGLPEWDGVPRIGSMLAERFHADHDEGYARLVEAFGRKWLVSCVARVMQPGCKVDTALTLIGEKGARKGTALEILAGAEWFSNSHIDIKGKAGYELLHQSGVWIWELAEGKALQGKSAEAVKAFMTGSSDRYRPAYGKMVVKRPRRTVFAVTLNNYQFLSDGPERRFWPVRLRRGQLIDTDWISDNRDQLGAEALSAYGSGEQWYLEGDLEELLIKYQQDFIIDDPWTIGIRTSLERGHTPNTTAEIMKDLELPAAQQHSGNSRRVAQICKDLGWVQVMKTETTEAGKKRRTRTWEYAGDDR